MPNGTLGMASPALDRVAAGSALASYLATVYRGALTRKQLAKVRLRDLHWWYMWAPLNVQCLSDASSVSASSCVAPLWPGGIAAAHITKNLGLRLLNVYGFQLLPSCHPQRKPASSPAAASWRATTRVDRGLLEVMRVASSLYVRPDVATGRVRTQLTREGGENGCWYVATRGSGVFLPLRRALVVRSRVELVERLNISTNRLPTDQLARAIRAATGGSAAVALLEDHVALCPAAARAGFETLILGEVDEASTAQHAARKGSTRLLEVISCLPSCTAAYLDSACAPDLRTGWDGSLPCKCDPTLPLLNCINTNGAGASAWPSQPPYYATTHKGTYGKQTTYRDPPIRRSARLLNLTTQIVVPTCPI
uniref:Uncharacterized protein n=1 Tax=Calcidiscus leptoporus TaxID=127549 RepID=A0A7S0J6R4_9EUKA|mmetsp:Transcript_41872/g.98107  ORF Transcript_41872/g.98107 Transcript_41872/m.98107 type:complete len:366 (+) Transcript_41872:206-1303(+)